MRHLSSLTFLGFALTGCWNNADSDPHALPNPPPPVSRDAGPEPTCSLLDSFRSPKSGAYCTYDIRLDASAQSYGAGTDVFVALHDGEGDFLELTDGDSLQASAGSESEALVLENELDGRIHYTAHFESSDPGKVTIALLRAPKNLPGALLSVDVAPAFVIVEPPATFKYGDGVHFSVAPAPASGTVAAYADGSCVLTSAFDNEINVPVVDGKVTLSTSDMIVPDGACDVTFHVRVETSSTADSSPAPSSTFVGLQERTFVSAMSP